MRRIFGHKNSQKGSSYTESLITIVVAGIACVAFISVVASLVTEARNREIRESMINHAFDGLARFRVLSSVGLPNRNDLEVDRTYEYAMDEDGVVELFDIENPSVDPLMEGKYDCIQGDLCETVSLRVEDDFFYRKVILIKLNSSVAKVKIEVGRMTPTGKEHLDNFSLDGLVVVN